MLATLTSTLTSWPPFLLKAPREDRPGGMMGFCRSGGRDSGWQWLHLGLQVNLLLGEINVRIISCFVVAALLIGIAAGQSVFEEDTELERLQELFSEGYPTVAAVEELEREARSRFDAGDCTAAIPVLEEWAVQANTLANLYRVTLEPFYRTLSSERDSRSYSLEELVELERINNGLIGDRNWAWVMIAECLVEQGNASAALAYYSQALGKMKAISENSEAWTRARNGVLGIIGHSNP